PIDMKYFSLVMLFLIMACNNKMGTLKTAEENFIKRSQTWQNKYVQGNKNLDEILEGLDRDIIMLENGKTWTYQEVVKFGPHLPEKQVIETYNDQVLLEKDLGYDYVSQKYISSVTGDTMRETSSRL